jgi:uncharacterized membrane protein YphA (DoxX/SURF4 family)
MLRFLGLLVVCTSVLIIVIFFMPWVKARGSILEPLDNTTKIIQRIEFTGVLRGAIKVTKTITDFLTEFFTGAKLTQTLNGFQVALHQVKEEGPKGGLLYLVPFGASFFCLFTVLGNKKRYLDLVIVIIALVLFLFLYQRAQDFDRDKVFIDIKSCWGFRTTLYLFLTVGALSLVRLLIPRRSIFEKNRWPDF